MQLENVVREISNAALDQLIGGTSRVVTWPERFLSRDRTWFRGLRQTRPASNRDTGRGISRKNVEVVRAGYAAISGMDAEALLLLCDADVEFESRITEVEGGRYSRHDGVRKWLADLLDVFDELLVEPVEIIESGNAVFVENHFRARSRDSGVDVEQRFFDALKLRDGKVIWWKFYESRSEALEAVGLSE